VARDEARRAKTEATPTSLDYNRTSLGRSLRCAQRWTANQLSRCLPSPSSSRSNSSLHTRCYYYYGGGALSDDAAISIREPSGVSGHFAAHAPISVTPAHRSAAISAPLTPRSHRRQRRRGCRGRDPPIFDLQGSSCVDAPPIF